MDESDMEIVVDERFPRTGFVVVGETCVVYIPKEDEEGTLVVSESNWGRPTSAEFWACRQALLDTYPGSKVVIR